MKQVLLEQNADKVFLHNLFFYLDDILDATPKNTKVYLVGGTLRNLFTYPYHSKLKLKQRDYDLVVFGNYKQFTKNLLKKGFTKGRIQRESQVSLLKPVFKGAKSLDDYVVLDVADSSQLGLQSIENIQNFIAKKINFTVNGLGIDIKNLKKKEWRKYIFSPFLKQGIQDVRKARIRLNPKKKNFFPSDIFACVRFVAAGFLPPSQREIQILKKAFADLPEDNLEKQKKKMYSYTNESSTKRAIKILKLENII